MTRAMGFMEENILQNETKEPEKPAVHTEYRSDDMH